MNSRNKPHFPFCQDLNERMLAKGKAKKVALGAVMNKLFKQVFGMVRLGEVYCVKG